MKLLIITQVVDRDYVPLCFFVRWLKEFGKRCERVTVVAQRVGEYELLANVRVLSLGKEKGVCRTCPPKCLRSEVKKVRRRVCQVCCGWWLLWRERRNYDAVFVHMTPIWVVLGAPIWILLRKRVYLWYEARGTKWSLRLALMIVRKAFSASLGGMPLKTKKSIITGHGIDTEFFHPTDERRDPHLLVTVGRLTKAKRLHLIIDAFAKLSSQYKLYIVGVPITEADEKTVRELKEKILMLGVQDRVTFGTVPDAELAVLLRRATLFLHASNATSLDKAPLQAMASGCLVVTASPVVKPHVTEVCRSKPETMSGVIQNLLSMPQEDQKRLRRELRAIVEHEHSLPRLIDRLVLEML